MGVIARNAYRNGFLKSEFWQNLRLDVLVKRKCQCHICGLRSQHNDIHHVRYPKRWWDTRSGDVIILCRECHEIMHKVIKGMKYDWRTFRQVYREVRKLRGYIYVRRPECGESKFQKYSEDEELRSFFKNFRLPKSKLSWFDIHILGVLEKKYLFESPPPYCLTG